MQIPPSSAGFPPEGYILRDGSQHYNISTSAPFAGPVTVCFTAFTVDDPTEFARLRILHREGQQLVDRTVLSPEFPAPNFNSRQVCARVEVPSDFYITIGPVFTVSGRVLTPGGQGLRNAAVTLTDYRGIKQVVTTSSFGAYQFANVRGGETFSITVQSRRYRFAARVIQVNGALADVDLIGLE